MKSTKLTAEDVRNCQWEVVEITPEYRRSIGRGTHPVTGQPIEVMRTEFLADEELQKETAFLRNENDAKRWSAGSGSEKGGNVPLIHVGKIPLNKFFSDFAGHHDDREFMRWWLNRDDNQVFRTRRGKI